MTSPPRSLPGPPGIRRRIVTACIVLAFVLLPALVVGARLDAPAAPGELARLAAALGPGADGPAGSDVARSFYVSMLGSLPAGLPAAEADRAELLARARLAQMAFVFVLGVLCYLSVLLARGRAMALLACGVLATLPPVAADGHVLRPETPAAVFAALALVLLQCMSQPGRLARSRGAAAGTLMLLGLAACAATSLALSVAALPNGGECLVVPGVVLSLSALQLAARALRIGRRRGGAARWPLRAMNRRLLPWTAAALLAPMLAVLLLRHTLSVPVEALPATASGFGLLPASPWQRAPLLLLVALGTVFGVARTGLRFGRRGRIGPDFVLFVHCAVQLAANLRVEGSCDTLRAAPAFAVVLGEGLLFAGGLLRRAAMARAPTPRRGGPS